MKKKMTNDQFPINTNGGVPRLCSAHYLIKIAKRYIHWTLVIGYWSLCVFSALAQGQAGTDIAALKAGVGARPLGMGSAFTAVADNADAPYWNPAGLGFVKESEITTMQTRLSTDTDHYYVSYIQPLFKGTLGISWIQVGLGDIAQTSSEVNSVNEVQNISVFSYFSNAYLLSYGQNLNDHIAVGLTGKYLTSDMFGISGGQAYGYSFTPGLILRLATCPLTLGLKIDELFNQQSWGTGTVERVSPKLRLGIAIKEPLGKFQGSLISLDISQTVRSTYAPEVSAGYEWSQQGLSLRAGLSEGSITAGAGFAIKNARVDYAYVTQASLSRENVHRISLTGNW